MSKWKLPMEKLLKSINDDDLSITDAQNRIFLKIAYELEQLNNNISGK